MSLRTLKLITFDVTNTLLKFRQSPRNKYGEIGAMFGLKEGREETLGEDFNSCFKEMDEKYPNFGKNSSFSWQEWWRKVVRNTFESYTTDSSILNAMADELIEMYKTKECWDMTEGSVDILELLKENNKKIGLISNFDPRLIEILDNMKLSSYFDFVLTSYDAGFLKPDVRIFAEALSRSKIDGVRPGDVLHIGDNVEKDYIGAKNAGWSSVLIVGDNDKKDILRQYKGVVKVDHVFNNLSDLCCDMRSGSFHL